MGLILILIAYVGGLALAALLIAVGALLLRRERPKRAVAVALCLAVAALSMGVGLNLSYENTALIGAFETATVTAGLAGFLLAGSMIFPSSISSAFRC